MAITDYSLYKLERSEQIRSFECTDRDLCYFLLDDALDYHRQLMEVTYLLIDEPNDAVVAYYTLFNDKITKDDDERSIWNRLSRLLPNPKRRKHYPAVKIGRLAVHSHYQRQGLGSDILTFLKVLFTSGNRTGCRFITVDAYASTEVLRFYSESGFSYLTRKDERDTPTRQMYFDLKTFSPADPA